MQRQAELQQLRQGGSRFVRLSVKKAAESQQKQAVRQEQARSKRLAPISSYPVLAGRGRVQQCTSCESKQSGDSLGGMKWGEKAAQQWAGFNVIARHVSRWCCSLLPGAGTTAPRWCQPGSQLPQQPALLLKLSLHGSHPLLQATLRHAGAACTRWAGRRFGSICLAFPSAAIAFLLLFCIALFALAVGMAGVAFLHTNVWQVTCAGYA